MPAISQVCRKNLDTIVEAARNGDLALLDCQDVKTGKPVVALIAVYRDENGDFDFVPLAKMFDGDPYEELNPPGPNGGYVVQAELDSDDENQDDQWYDRPDRPTGVNDNTNHPSED